MKPIRALIIDDDQHIIDIIKEWAAKHTSDLVIEGIAMNGVEAIKAIFEYKPDLIFLDVNLPLMNGIKMIAKLPEKKFKIIFTAATDEHALTAIKLGAADYLIKPIKPAEFLLAIQKVRNKISIEKAKTKRSRLPVKKRG